jgi:hypothetical protein
LILAFKCSYLNALSNVSSTTRVHVRAPLIMEVTLHWYLVLPLIIVLEV